MNIYQEIWNADQSGNGVRPILVSQAGDTEAGYVNVAIKREAGEPDTKVLPEVVIPANKMTTYDRVRALFDNYALDEQASEVETPDERAEVHDLLEAVIDTAPMQVARAYVSAETGTPVSRDRWYATLMELWFRRFNQGGDRDLSGFEHVFVGEQEGPKVQGYHFWYKYHLDDGLAGAIDRNKFPGFKDACAKRPTSSLASAGPHVLPRQRRAVAQAPASNAALHGAHRRDPAEPRAQRRSRA